jgi:dTDP-4-dehydrorhamnose 3,5-epimerase
MIFSKTDIVGVFLIELQKKEDLRGFFECVFRQKEFFDHGIDFSVIQANESFTEKKGAVRGLHFQKPPFEEDKLVRCSRGKIFDVALDIRKNSPTFGKWFATELSEENQRMLLIPKGCAHGFQTLTENCLISYFVSQQYSPSYEAGIRWDDPFHQISWPITPPTIMSEKDASWPDYL